MACRVQGAVVGVAILLSATICFAGDKKQNGSHGDWKRAEHLGAHAHLKQHGRSNGVRPLTDTVVLPSNLRRAKRKDSKRADALGLSCERILANWQLFHTKFPRFTSFENLVRTFRDGTVQPQSPLFAGDGFFVKLMSWINEAATFETYRKTANRAGDEPPPEPTHGLEVSLWLRPEQRSVSEMMADLIHHQVSPTEVFLHCVALGHDLCEDVVQPVHTKPGYRPSVRFVHPWELDPLLNATFSRDRTVTGIDRAIAATAIFQRKLNATFSDVTISDDRQRRWGVGDGIVALTKILFDSNNAPKLAGQEVGSHEHLAMLNSMLTARMLIEAELPELAMIKIADIIKTIGPGHIEQNSKLDKPAKQQRLRSAAAGRLMVVQLLHDHYKGQLPEDLVQMAYVSYQGGYVKDEIRKIVADRDAILKMDQEKDAMVALYREISAKDGWVTKTLDDHRTILTLMHQNLNILDPNGMPANAPQF